MHDGEASTKLLLESSLTSGQQKILKELLRVFLTSWRSAEGTREAVIPKGRYMIQWARHESIDLQAECSRLPVVTTRFGTFGLIAPAADRSDWLHADADWRLTLAGVLSIDPAHSLAQVMTDFILAAAVQVAQVHISPWDADPIQVDEEAILQHCDPGIQRSLPYLQPMFSTLPPLTGMFRLADQGRYRWQVPDTIDAFTECGNGVEVLSRALDLMAPPPAPVRSTPLSPMALAEALDHLDAAWYRSFNEGLFARQAVDLATCARITVPVETAQELKLAQIDLGNIVSRWQPLKPRQQPGPKGTTGTVLADHIVDSVAARHPSINKEALQSALKTLEGPVLLRNGTAHTGSQGRVLDGHAILGVNPEDTPAAQWETIQRSVLTAAAEVRSLIALVRT